MIDGLIKSMLPAAVLRLKQIPPSDKLIIAEFVAELCACYRAGDRLRFEEIVNATKFPELWKTSIISAVWD